MGKETSVYGESQKTYSDKDLPEMMLEGSLGEYEPSQPSGTEKSRRSAKAQKKLTKKKKEPKADKIPAAEVDDQIIRFLCNRPSRFSDFDGIPRMPEEMQLVRSIGGGSNAIISIKDNTGEVVLVETAAERLRDFLLQLPENMAPYYLTGLRCKAIVESFRATAAHHESMPKIAGFKSDPELVMNRLAFDPVPTSMLDLEEKAPIFAGMMARTGNFAALMARIGSIFDPKADRKQAVWIYGKKDCGKSQLSWVIQQLSMKYAVLGAEDYNDKNFKANLLNCRVGLIQEASARFIRSDIFKSLTGDGTHAINQKYQPVFNAQLPILLFAFSNDAPEIPNDDALIERVIACKMVGVPAKERYPEYQLREYLAKEIPYILGACLDVYQSMTPGERIPCGTEDLMASVEAYEEDYRDWLERKVVAAPGCFVTLSELNRLFELSGWKSTIEQHKVKRVLMSNFPVKKTQRTCRGSDGAIMRVWVYDGIKLRGLAHGELDKVSFYREHFDPSAD